MAPPKTFLLTADGTSKTVPHECCATVARSRALRLGAVARCADAPDRRSAGRRCWPRPPGPERRDVPDTTWNNLNKIVPSPRRRSLSFAEGDPRSARHGCHRRRRGGGRHRHRHRGSTAAEHCIRYLEVDSGPGKGPLLVPMNLSRIVGTSMTGLRVQVKSITAAQFANVPRREIPESVTFLEEDRDLRLFRRRSSLCHPAAVGARCS